LSGAIKDLPRGYRTIFLLHEVEGYEHQEIADLLGCSVGNSKSKLHKAKLRIREFLAHRPAAQPAALSEKQSYTETARPLLEEWKLVIGQAAAMQAAPDMAQLAGHV